VAAWQFPNGNLFGYDNSASFPILFYYDLGSEAFIEALDRGDYADVTEAGWHLGNLRHSTLAERGCASRLSLR
jgi:hypothetical protein